jgi:hypothetical protein
MFLHEKGCFPLRYLDLLSDPQMDIALKELSKMQTENGRPPLNTYKARLDVDFLPLELISSDRLDNLKIILIISVLSGALKPETSEFVYHNISAQKNSFDLNKNDLRLPRLYKSAVYQLHQFNRDKLNLLRQCNEDYIRDNTAEFLQRLYIFIQNPASYGFLLNNPNEDKNDMLRLLKEYLLSNHELREKWNDAFPDSQITNDSTDFNYVHSYETNDTQPYTGFYCSICNQFIGNYTINDEPDYNRIREIKNIHSCNR